MRTKSRVDKNQPQIVKGLRRVGAVVIHCHELKKDTFDLLVGFRGTLFVLEVKNPEDYPKSFYTSNKYEKNAYLEKRLTEEERTCQKKLNSVNIPYHIVYDLNSALEVIGALQPSFE